MTLYEKFIMVLVVYNLIPSITLLLLSYGFLLPILYNPGNLKDILTILGIVNILITIMFVVFPVVVTYNMEIVDDITKIMKQNMFIGPYRHEDSIVLMDFKRYWDDEDIGPVEKFVLYYDLKERRYIQAYNERKEKDEEILLRVMELK